MTEIASSREPIHVEATRFRSSVSESMLQNMGGAINYLLGAVLPVGSVVHSMLSEAQMQGEAGTGWILADGRDVTGSDYALLTSNTTVPDLRGVFLRGRNYARDPGVASSPATCGNSAGDLAVGTFEHAKLLDHIHYLNQDDDDNNRPHRLENTGAALEGTIEREEGSEYKLHRVSLTGNNMSYNLNGGTTINDYETAPRSVTVNIFIRIN